MKIKITEGQAKRMKLINEDTNPLSQFEQLCKIKIQEINKLYVRVINLTVAEIVNNEVNMSEIDRALNKISTALYEANKVAYRYIENLPEEDLDLVIDKAYDAVTDKLTSLEIIVMELETLQNKAEEHHLANSFSDTNPIDITPSGL